MESVGVLHCRTIIPDGKKLIHTNAEQETMENSENRPLGLPVTEHCSTSTVLGSQKQKHCVIHHADQVKGEEHSECVTSTSNQYLSTILPSNEKPKNELSPFKKIKHECKVLEEWKRQDLIRRADVDTPSLDVCSQSPIQYKSFFSEECEEIAKQILIKETESSISSKRKAEDMDWSTIEAEPPPFYCTPKSVLDGSEYSAKRRRMELLDCRGQVKSNRCVQYFGSPFFRRFSLPNLNESSHKEPWMLNTEDGNLNPREKIPLRVQSSTLPTQITENSKPQPFLTDCTDPVQGERDDSSEFFCKRGYRYFSTPMPTNAKPKKRLAPIMELESNVSEERENVVGAMKTDVHCMNMISPSAQTPDSQLQTPQFRSFFEVECEEISKQLKNKAMERQNVDKCTLELNVSTIESEPIPYYWTPLKSVLLCELSNVISPLNSTTTKEEPSMVHVSLLDLEKINLTEHEKTISNGKPLNYFEKQNLLQVERLVNRLSSCKREQMEQPTEKDKTANHFNITRNVHVPVAILAGSRTVDLKNWNPKASEELNKTTTFTDYDKVGKGKHEELNCTMKTRKDLKLFSVSHKSEDHITRVMTSNNEYRVSENGLGVTSVKENLAARFMKHNVPKYVEVIAARATQDIGSVHGGVGEANATNDIDTMQCEFSSASTTQDIDTMHSEVGAANVTQDIGTVHSKVVAANDTQDIRSVHREVGAANVTQDIAAPTSPFTDLNTTQVIGSVHGKVGTVNVKQDLGSVYDVVDLANATQDFGSVYGEVVATNATQDIGSLHGEAGSASTTQDIRSMYDEVIGANTIQNIGSVHGEVGAANKMQDIGSVHREVGAANATQVIGLVYGEVDKASAMQDIGSVHREVGTFNATQVIGSVYGDMGVANITQDIGSVHGEVGATNTTQNIGSMHRKLITPNIMQDIGSVPREVVVDNVTQESGPMYGEVHKTSAMQDIGSVYGEVGTTNAMQGIGSVFGEVGATNTTQDIGLVYGEVGATNATMDIRSEYREMITANVTQDIGSMHGESLLDNATQEIVSVHGVVGAANVTQNTRSVHRELGAANATPKFGSVYDEVGANNATKDLEPVHCVVDAASATQDIGSVLGTVTNVTLVSGQLDSRPAQCQQKIGCSKGIITCKITTKMDRSYSKNCVVDGITDFSQNEVCRLSFRGSTNDPEPLEHCEIMQEAERTQDDSIFSHGCLSFVTSTPLPGFSNFPFIKKSCEETVQHEPKLCLSTALDETKSKFSAEQRTNKQQGSLGAQLSGNDTQGRRGISRGSLLPRITRRSILPRAVETPRLLQPTLNIPSANCSNTQATQKSQCLLKEPLRSKIPQRGKGSLHNPLTSSTLSKTNVGNIQQTLRAGPDGIPQCKTTKSCSWTPKVSSAGTRSSSTVSQIPNMSSLVRPTPRLCVPGSGPISLAGSRTTTGLKKTAYGSRILSVRPPAPPSEDWS